MWVVGWLPVFCSSFFHNIQGREQEKKKGKKRNKNLENKQTKERQKIKTVFFYPKNSIRPTYFALSRILLFLPQPSFFFFFFFDLLIKEGFNNFTNTKCWVQNSTLNSHLLFIMNYELFLFLP